MKPSDSQLDDPFLLLINTDGIIMDARETICAALGWTPETLVNKTLNDLFEYGADLVMDQLQAIRDGANAESEFSVSTLVRRSDQTSFPATAIVRRIAVSECFTITFDDLPVEAQAEAAYVANAPGAENTLAAEAVEAGDAVDINQIFSARVAADEPEVAPTPAPEDQPAHATSNGNGNGSGTGFRNIFLSGAQRSPMRVEAKLEPKPELKPETKIVTKAETNQVTKSFSNGAGDFAKQLEAERHERRRLEARVLSLNDQLQTVHAQLKASLESENIYQKRLFECEEGLRKAEEIKAASESAVNEEKQQRERIEEEFAKFKSASAQVLDDRKAWQEEWLSKLASALTVLQESDGRLAKEIEKRRELQQALRGLHEDFCAEADKQIDGASVAEAVHA